MKRFAFTLIELLVVIAIIGILFVLLDPIGVFFWFVFGWIPGIYHLANGLKHEPAAVLIGLASLVFLPMFVHLFLRRLPSSVFQTWRLRQSIGIVGVGCTFIVATISMIALIHEMYWIAHPKEPMAKDYVILMITINNLKGIVWAANQYADEHENAFPAGGTLLDDGRPGHGWMTQLLPYMEDHHNPYGYSLGLYRKIDMQKPWNDPANAPVFQEKAPKFFRTATRRPDDPKYKDAQGYGLTDFAANEHVMPFGRSLRMAEITDGTSNTILCGEVAENPQPWGSPFNARDPALGINRSPHDFGYKKPYNTANFAMCDGSVQKFSDTTDLNVLKALATPNGGESVVP